MKFETTEEDDKKIEDWKEKQMKKNPDNGSFIGGRFVYEFIPTGLGTLVTVKDTILNEELDLTDYSDF